MRLLDRGTAEKDVDEKDWLLMNIIEELSSKGRFLTVEAKRYLEELPEKHLARIKERIKELSDQNPFVEVDELKELLKIEEELTIPSITPFNPAAKGIKSKIKILRDPGSEVVRRRELRTEDLTEMFKSRLERIADVIAKQIGLRSVQTIGDLVRRNFKDGVIIGLVGDKKEKRNGILLSLEDITGKILCFVSKDRTPHVYSSVLKIPPDSVIGARVRRGGNLFVIEEVYIPRVKRRETRWCKDDVYVVLTSDLHVGSRMFLEGVFRRFVLWLNGKYGNDGMREVASKVKYLVIAGDVVDGVGVFPKQKEQLKETNVRRQYEMAAELLSLIPDYIEILILPGNHDATLSAHPQPPIWRSFSEPLYAMDNIHMVGNPVNVSLHNVNILAFHGESLEDMITLIPGLNKERISEAMKILLDLLHLSPIYGGKTKMLSLKEDLMTITLYPDVFHTGHIHINDHQRYNGSILVNSGTWQRQTDYQRERGLNPTPGKVPVVNLRTGELRILSFI